MEIVDMKKIGRFVTACSVVLLAVGNQAPAWGQEEPIDLDERESVNVRLVLIDAVVLDQQDRTVPDLTREDFVILVDGKEYPINTLDVFCAAGAEDDPRGVRNANQRAMSPSHDTGRKIILAMDYLHLTPIERVDVLEKLREMVKHGTTGGDMIMVVALNGGLRVEQSFTRDRQRVLDTLERMEYDISLWNMNSFHLTEEPFFAGLGALMEVLEAVPGNKAMVMFSNNGGRSDENDPYFAEIAALASTARCSIYTVQARGLMAGGPG